MEGKECDGRTHGDDDVAIIGSLDPHDLVKQMQRVGLTPPRGLPARQSLHVRDGIVVGFKPGKES